MSHKLSHLDWLLSKREVFRLAVENSRMESRIWVSEHSYSPPCYEATPPAVGMAVTGREVFASAPITESLRLLSGRSLCRSPFGLKTIFPLG